MDLDVLCELCEPGVLGESEYGEKAETSPPGDALNILLAFGRSALCSVRLMRDQRRDRLSREPKILTGILIIAVVVIQLRPNVEVRRSLSMAARLLGLGVVCVLNICMI